MFPVRTALSLGGNLGDVAEAFRQAAELLGQGGFAVQKTASVYRTTPVDCPPGTPDFCNTAMTGLWSDTPEKLLDLTQHIEVLLGRPADHGYHQSRTLDIDILFMGGIEMATPRLTLPHPEAARRRFVLDPLSEIAPEICDALLGKSFLPDAMEVIRFFYPEDTPFRRLLLAHSMQVRDKTLQVIHRHPELGLDPEEAACAAMLHDIGIGRCHAPGILCEGGAHYLAHGLIGGGMLREYGMAGKVNMEPFARVCERHTGSGITQEEIRVQHLPLPERDLLPETLLEKAVCYADKFFSKSGDMQEKELPGVQKSLAKFGSDTTRRFEEMHRLFG